MHVDDEKNLYWLGEYKTMQELWQSYLYCVEIFYLGINYYVVVILCLQDYAIGDDTHTGYRLVCDSRLFSTEGLFYSTFKRSDRRKAAMRSHSLFVITVKSPIKRIQPDSQTVTRFFNRRCEALAENIL